MRDTVSRDGAERQLVVQVLKSVVAAVTAWLIAVHVIDVDQPFVAPMIALLMVQPTIVQSLVKGSQQVIAVIAGMLIALAVFQLIDTVAIALAVALLITTALGAWRRLGDQGIYAPVVALTMISLHSVGETYFLRRLAETAVGVLVGAAVNLAVKPPHYLGSARASATTCIDEVTSVLRDVAQGIRSGWDLDDARGWAARADRLEAQVGQCLEDLGWAGQSIRLNPRRSHAETRTPVATYRPVIAAVGRIAEPLEHLARTLAIRTEDDEQGSPHDTTFLADCAALLDDIAESVADWANAETPIRAPSHTQEYEQHVTTHGPQRLGELADRIRHLPRDHVAYAGAILVAIEQILDALRQHEDERNGASTSPA